MTRDRKYQLRVHSSDLARWNEAARAVGLQTAVWVRTRLNDASILELENPSDLVEVEVEICPRCGGTRQQHELMGGCPAYVLDMGKVIDERLESIDPTTYPTLIGGDAERAGAATPPAEPTQGEGTLLEEMEKNMGAFPVVVDKTVPPGTAELQQDGKVVAKLTGIKDFIDEQRGSGGTISEEAIRNQSKKPVPLAKDCRGNDLHWRLRRGEACRWCGGVA